MNKLLIFKLIIAAVFAFWGCGEKGAPLHDRKIQVFVSILPQAYFVERVCGEHVSVHVLVGKGQSPHTFEPTPKQMARLGEARLFFRIGIPFEQHILDKIANINRNIRIIDTRKGITLRSMKPHHQDENRHEKVGNNIGHSVGDETDPHIWLDPAIVKIMATTICTELKKIDPVHTSDYNTNLKVFHSDLDSVHAKLTDKLTTFRGRTFFVYHPSFGYFGDAYGLAQVAVETRGREPGPKELILLIKRIKRENVNIIFVQPQFSDRTARRIEDTIGVKVVFMDPMAKDYIRNLEEIAEKISGVFELSAD